MKNNRADIGTKDDVKLMVDTFYGKVNSDTLLSSVFNDHSKVNWDTHLPKMYDFWNTLLFADGNYKGSPFEKHIGLPVDRQHFKHWMEIFCQNIDEHFIGEVAEQTKLRAKSIAWTFESKLDYLKNQ
jgi:hemoglobin